MYKTILSALIICLFSGCATQRLADNQFADQLAEGHGWLAINALLPNDAIAFELTAGKIGSERYKTPLYDKGQSLKLMQLPAGHYRLSGLYDRAIVWEFVDPGALDDFTFNVTAGGLTLLGQVTVNGDTMSLQPLAGESSEAILRLASHSTGIQRVTADKVPARVWPIGSARCGAHVSQGHRPCVEGFLGVASPVPR